MLVKNVTKNPNGTYEMAVTASGAEMDFLTSVAVNLLIVAGTVSLKEEAEGVPDQEIELVMPENGTLQ